MFKALKHPLWLGLGVLTLIIAIGLVLIFQYLALEQQRDLRQWQLRLGVVAETRAETVDGWLGERFADLEELAGNASLQMYLTQVGTAEGETEARQATLGYLRNLILAAAQRSGFQGKSPGGNIPANLPRSGHAGLALYDRSGQTLVSTPHMPAADDRTREQIEAVLASGERRLQDIFLGADRHALVGFAVPVFAVQGMEAARQPHPVGVLYGVRDAEAELFPLLASREPQAQGETLLVAEQDGLAVYLSPLRDDTPPTQRRLTLQIQQLAATEALHAPGEFRRVPDYRGEEVLMTSRALEHAPWVMLHKVDADTALSESREHRRFLLSVFLLTLFLVSAALVAAWRHGTSLRAQRMAAELAARRRELEEQGRLLHAVTDNVTDFLFLLDPELKFLFANRPLANTMAIPVEDIPGKSLASVLGTDMAGALSGFLQSRTDNPASRLLDLQIAGHQRRFECRVLELPERAGLERTTLVVLHDVTALHRAQQQRAQTLQQTIQALMRAVDTHDPHSADHSARTAAVTAAVARAMQLPEEERRALDMAANLANVGKIFLPREILTKTGPLSEAEQAQLRQHVQYSLDILSNLEFDGPVLEIIAQKQEHLDGSGYPNGLQGEQIRLSARILAVANAFVALVSPRAWRERLTPEAALDQLLKGAGSSYDRQVIAALFHVVENDEALEAAPGE
ncbi:metal-dependent phosphohydrolase [Thiohalobacter thiocyanaticus]|uniref:Metal-dependent phosphohydrolase n=1 Tax=Thiohalobacter thiocyanaticus TaxID=585455 RepID=A0A1Z4VTY6_9GAMM|nr:HD domain-containing phosphohydrolase [Thiohalobacter thiocyanaticus]BAZ94973.1 metal-dependent phosphohydrolase [Thiohalobacter thiocyanaticus]